MDIQPYLDHTDQLFEIYKKLKLQALDDIDEWHGTTTIAHFSNVTRSRQNIHPFPTTDFKIYDELTFITGDIKFCAGMLHYLLPHTTKITLNNDSNLIDRRYAMHVNFGYQSIYHFWDRIGDFLWLYFPTGIPEDQIGTGNVLKFIPNEYKATTAYKELLKIYHDAGAAIFERHHIVHRFSIGIEIAYQRMAAYGNDRKLRRLQEKLKNYRDKVTKALPESIKAIEATLLLIQELPVTYPQD